MVEAQEHPEQKLEQYIAFFLTKLIRFIQIVIPLIAKFSKEHPNVFLTVSIVLIIYTSWRLICNLATILKRMLFVTLSLFIIFLFLRGFDQVVFKDMPLLYSLIKQNRDLEIVFSRWTSYLSKSSADHSTAVVSYLSSKLRELF
ncbi:hypothetical protein HG535_0F03500 [Zygotorulaspora mrakii]|uniref:Uncharacterized protein n=1 Tax=Zygotorulaspora mrakii TaxID=42260 RepID=A0A7H9B7A6_ZYGMR|nr:uncharacterized protein HG535_0F03500 [Zygotorulaspora mrakii]QLG73839.1 hypothetical protein HG535_0F03500 [Zygotorulaspora mrakii]